MSALRGSVTRRAPGQPAALPAVARPRGEWRSGDFVLGEVVSSRGPLGRIESVDGRMVEVAEGDLVTGALGQRFATLEATGEWEAIGDELEFEALTAAGVFGRCTSIAQTMPPLVRLRYRGHVEFPGASSGRGDNMADFAAASSEDLRAPVILLIGTSMDAGKTTTARVVVRLLKQRGMRVGGAKLTGVARYRDILAMSDAGADVVADFVDAGLPSTIAPADEYKSALVRILSVLAADALDVVVAEAGASPLEPYNSDVATGVLGARVAFTVLCASDPYAVVGVIDAFDKRPDLVTGRCTSTAAGIALVRRLTGLPALNVLDRESHQELDRVLAAALAGWQRQAPQLPAGP